MAAELPSVPPHAFAKEDGSPDSLFYEMPRFVTHIDDRAVAAVTALYRELFPANGVILDLMGSWVAHLPADVSYAEVIGHGMNEAELASNPRYTRWFVQDLNRTSELPLATASLDGATICVSIQYLQDPVTVLKEIKRALRPGGPLAITFSNRCFPTKAVAIWLALGDEQHLRLVSRYLEEAGFGIVTPRVLIPPDAEGDPLYAVIGRSEAC